MTPYGLGPWYGVFAYHSAHGAHKLTISTTDWSPGGTNGFGQFLGHDDITMNDAQDMAEDLATDLAEFMLASSGFDSFTIYSKPTQADPSIPVAIVPLAIAGTSVATTPSKATMSTWSFRTTLYHRKKLVLLDTPVASNFAPTNAADWGADDLAVLGALSDLTKGWAGRDGAPIQSGIRKTYTLSDVLEHAYGMS